jgi:hypothetical protein
MPPSAVLKTLNHVWPHLAQSGIPIAVAGGIALSYWGNPRSTQDIDLAIYTDQFDPIRSILHEAGFAAKSSEEKDLGLFRLNQFEFDPVDAFVTVEIDLMVSDSEYYAQIAKRFVTVELAGVLLPIYVLSREDLVLHKVFSGRLIDQADVHQLLESHWDALDRPYLEQWSKALDIHHSFLQAVERIKSA